MSKPPIHEFKEGDRVVYFKPYGFPMITDPNKGKLVLNDEFTVNVHYNNVLLKEEYFLIDKNGVKLPKPYSLVELICFFKKITTSE